MSQAASNYAPVAGEIRLPAPLSRYGASPDGHVIGYWRGRVFLAGGLDKDGYRRFTLVRDDGKRTYVRRSTLICSAFNGPRPDGMEALHLNGEVADDRAANLAWGTRQQCIDGREARRRASP